MNQMERYFEVHYPRRLSELCSKIDSYVLDTKTESIMDENSDVLTKLVIKIYSEVIVFMDNTKLHLTSFKDHINSDKYVERLMPSYILQGLKEPYSRIMFSKIFIEKEGK